ncbi:hypothetical protein HMI56_003693 [Coelomomyces lativittatus]|nr:hypothetical protein HMI56_003693 [Coelomomyces lativittatus]
MKEIIGDESLGKYNRQPKLRIQKVENVNLCLNFIKRRGVNLTNIGAEDIVDANEKLVLGMAWTVILRFTIADISEEGLTAKEGLLLWCQRKTGPYAPTVNIKDFHTSWQDGLAFCALIHHHRPDLINFDQLNKKDAKANMQLAFDVAQKDLNIPKLLDVEDVVDLIKPDERSIMTYVAQYFHTFSTSNKVETASRRVTKFVQMLQSVQEMQHEYETKTTTFLNQLESHQASWKNTQFTQLYKDVRQHSLRFNDYKSTVKRAWIAEKRDLATLLSNIQTKLQTYQLAPYQPPEQLTLTATELAWQKHVTLEGDHKMHINKLIKSLRDQVQLNYAQLANPFQSELHQLTQELGGLATETSLVEQKNRVVQWQLRCSDFEKRLLELHQWEGKCIEANVEENEYTIYSYEDLKFYFEMFKEGLAKKLAFIENQIVASTMSNLTPAQLEEFESTFRHFDKDLSNTLSPLEFKASLAGLGIAYENEEFDKVFSLVSQHGPEVTFEQFVTYMRNIMEDTTSPNQLAEAFKTLSISKDYVTETDLRTAHVDEVTLNYLKSNFSPINDGYDFQSYLNKCFQPKSN